MAPSGWEIGLGYQQQPLLVHEPINRDEKHQSAPGTHYDLVWTGTDNNGKLVTLRNCQNWTLDKLLTDAGADAGALSGIAGDPADISKWSHNGNIGGYGCYQTKRLYCIER